MNKAILIIVAGFALAAGFPAAAPVQEWPQRPVRIIVSFGAGGGADIISRIVGQAMQDRLGQPFVIENRPGAGGTIGNEAVARADKDGYTLGMMTAGQIIAVMARCGQDCADNCAIAGASEDPAIRDRVKTGAAGG